MAGRKATKDQKEKWRQIAKEKENAARELVTTAAEKFVQDPKALIEYLEFSSRFRQYSANNRMLIMMQNRGAAFCLPFAAWKKEGYSVNHGEHGLMLFVPVQLKTIIDDSNNAIPWSKASEELKKRASAGELKIKSRLSFKIGTTFDITQTDFPTEDYPKILGLGHTSDEHAKIYDALKEHCKEIMGCPVVDTEDAIKSAGVLKGFYDPVEHRIEINSLLDDTAKVSTLTHEMGHALLHSGMNADKKSEARIEFEADAISIMLSCKLDIEIEESRRSHIAKAWKGYEQELGDDGNLDEAFESVFKSFEEFSDAIETTFQKHGIEFSKSPDIAFEKYSNEMQHRRGEHKRNSDDHTIANVAKDAKTRAAEHSNTDKTHNRQRKVGPKR